jgi:hypothetical protein
MQAYELLESLARLTRHALIAITLTGLLLAAIDWEAFKALLGLHDDDDDDGPGGGGGGKRPVLVRVPVRRD